MAQENMISISFTQEELNTLNGAIAQIATILKGKAQSLTPAERQTYGRVKYEKKVWIDKVKQLMDQNPTQIPTYIDKAEYDRDYAAHQALDSLIAAFEQQFQLMEDTAMLLGHDLDISSHMFYRHTKTAAQNNSPGARTIYEDLKQQFKSKRKKTETNTHSDQAPQ